jgi:hypothetical protein
VIDHYEAGRTLADFRVSNRSKPSRLTGAECALVALLETAVE